MKGIFLAYGDRENYLSTGVGKKVSAQLDLFNSDGMSCKLEMLDCYNSLPIDKFFLRLPFTNKSPKWTYRPEFSQVDFIYLRRPEFMTGYMIDVLKRVKGSNPEIKILLEIPTFPYDTEVAHREDGLPFDLPLLWRDRYWRKKLGGCVDRIILLNREIDDLWGIPVVHIRNGIDIKKVLPRKCASSDDKRINLIGVAMFKEWHGYERVIEGLSEYALSKGADKPDVHLYLVGEGPEVASYKKLVEENNLTETVHFCGFKSGQELDRMYDNCHIGLASFGCYKKNLEEVQDLKSREYLAKGLPIVSGCNISELDDSNQFYLQFPNTDSAVDIDRVVQFYRELRKTKSQEDVTNEIRSFAARTVSIEAGMDQVMSYLKGNE